MPNNFSNNLPPSLVQGKKYKNFQKKIENNLEKNAKKLSGKEGFTSINISDMNLPQNSLAIQTNNIVNSNTYTPMQEQAVIDLQAQYQSTLAQYRQLLAQMGNITTNYVDRISSSNPYLGKNIRFANGSIFYVTNQGVAKPYQNWQIFDATDGQNGCPANFIQLDISDGGNTALGQTLPTTPSLIVGTPMTAGQSCGYEGENVYVNQIVSESNTKYVGCYADNISNPLMTFIGDTPPPPVSLLNGSFSQPVLANNSYELIGVTHRRKGLYKLLKGAGRHTTQLTSWTFNGYLVNSSTDWTFPIPYPSGNQCVAIQNSQTLSQVVKLDAGATYILSFMASGSDGGNGSGESNPLTIQISNTDNSNPINIWSYFQPTVNVWNSYEFSVTATNSQNYLLSFIGTLSNSTQSTALQNVSLTASSSNSGSFSYAQCQQAAIDGGYQYFALQNVNDNTALGYCAVSNNKPNSTSLGHSYVISSQRILWQSNTSGQSGNSAILNQSGSLSVVNSSGTSVFSTSNDYAQPGNYYGCYGDSKNRAMSGVASNGSQKYNLEQCQQEAQNAGAAYFGLQNSTSGTNAVCFYSSDFSQTTKYGMAGNCRKVRDPSGGYYYSGGGWSNAVYDANYPNSNYFLLLNEDNNTGQMIVYRGTGPNDKQDNIWTSEVFGGLVSNPNFQSKNNKYGQNWMPVGSTLAAGDYLSSTDGGLVLMMQADGNLTLSTFTNASNCTQMSDGNRGGGIGANALYNINSVGYPANMGLLAYIDQNTNLTAYSSDNTQYSNNYTQFDALNSSGNDILNASFSNATVDQCQAACSDNAECAGFVMSSSGLGSTCYPKTIGMYPKNAGQIDPNYTTYVRTLEPITPAPGISNVVNNITSSLYQKYPSSSTAENSELYSLSNATSAQKAQLADLESQLNVLTQQLNNYTNQFSTGTQLAENQSATNIQNLGGYLGELNQTNQQIKTFNTNIDNILNDSDIVILQKNYNYLFWSILAAGTVLVSMSLARSR